MDLHTLLNSVKTLNDYITATETIVNKCAGLNILLNMSAVLNLKKVRSLEIEYFNKCEGNGAAFVVFERMLKQPPSKIWVLLGKELISMIQYWLDAVRKHLISHSPHWWTFLRSLLKFSKEVKTKDPTLVSIIVEQTTECLLDLACNSRLDELQRQEVLQTLNECCADASRELRARMRDQLNSYFVKLGTILSSCGHLPTQVAILETLLRWLVGRYDPQARRTAANAWFPLQMYRSEAVDLFLERPWRDFYQDARDFLTAHNASRPDRVTSVVCKKLTVGHTALINGPQSRVTWLDVNATTKSVTVIMDPRVLESFASTNYKSYETLTVCEENVFSVQLYRESGETILSLHTLEPLSLQPSEHVLQNSLDVTASIGSKTLPDVDRALRIVFYNKYQALLDANEVGSSPRETIIDPAPKKLSSSEEERCSNVVVRRRKQSGYIVRSRNPLPLNSPSTTSTTSLAQLHDKLAALPPIYYTKEPIKICAQPELPVVREVSECEDKSVSLSNASRSKPFGVCQSDSEVKTYSRKRNISPVVPKTDKPVSLMLMTTLGSADQSIISNTIEQLNKSNSEFDLLDLLVKDAFQNGPEKDSGIIPDKKTQDSEVIENTPFEKQAQSKISQSRKVKNIVVNSTSDESNTEIVSETPCFVNVRKKRTTTKAIDKTVVNEPPTFDAKVVDTFFSQHFAENDAGRIDISPTLAKKINETSSESSGDSPKYIIDENFNKDEFILESDIIDCLNSIVDEVCNGLDKCAEILSREQENYDILELKQNIDAIQNSKINTDVPKVYNTVKSNDDPNKVKLKFKPTKKRVPKKNKKQKKVAEQEQVDNTIIEEDNIFIDNTSTNSPVHKPETSSMRKRRKLYSPKDDGNDHLEEMPRAQMETKESTANKTPIATYYKELEVARKLRSRVPRKFRTSTEPLTSPKTKKMNDLFDKIKGNVDNPEKITLVKSNKRDLTFYNYTSESEDEDFKKKKIEVQKRVSSTSIDSAATKRGRLVNRINYSESNNNNSADESNRKPKKRKIAKQSKPRSRKVKIDHSVDLIDERMREGPPEVLETSFVKEDTAVVIPDPEPPLVKEAEMEIIPDDTNDVHVEIIEPAHRSQRKKRTEMLQIKKEKGLHKKTEKSAEILKIKKEKGTSNKETSKNVSSEPGSPLPGLVVETEKPRQDDMSASVEANMLQKFKKIYKEGPDINETDTTQNLVLRSEKYDSLRVSNSDVVEIFDAVDNINNLLIAKEKENDFHTRNPNPHLESTEISKPIVLGSLSERSIPTGGKSPITGHNDLDELPPNTELLQEKFKSRDLELQDMSQSMIDFFYQLRSGLLADNTSKVSTDNIKHTSPVVQVTKESSKEHAMSLTSGVSTPKIVVTRMSSEEIEKYVSPTKSKSSSVRSPEVVLKRISSDEISRWLPIPCRSYDIKEDKKYSTRQTTKKVIDDIEKTPKKEVEIKRKSMISPVKLSLDIIEESPSVVSNKENVDMNFCKSRSQTKSTKSREVKKCDKEAIEIIKEPYKKHFDSKDASSTTVHKSSEVEKNKASSAVDKMEEVRSLFTSEGSRSIASVNEWFKRNIPSSSSSKDVTKFTLQDTLQKVLETLEITLNEIHQSTGKKLASMFLDNQKRLNSFQEAMHDMDKRIHSEIIAGITDFVAEKFAERDHRFREMIEDFEKGQKERACEVIRADVKQKTLMVTLLREDVQALLDFINKQNK